MKNLILCVIPFFLLGCSGSDDEVSPTLAEMFSDALTITENDQDSSVFISDLDLEVWTRLT